MTALTAARVVTPDGIVAPGVVEIDGGYIVAVSPAHGPVPERTLCPGFVDLQVNGHDDVDVARAAGHDWDRLDALLVAQGVTTWCPTLVTAPLASYAEPLERIAAAAARDGARPAIAGVHLEGPFLGSIPGAHPPDLLLPFDREWLATLPDIVRVVTLGPELDGAVEVIAALAVDGVLVALGHSAATLEEIDAATDAGARLVTHCFNGMPPLHHRQPGMVGAALGDDRLAISLIADLVHVHPTALAIAVRAKAPPVEVGQGRSPGRVVLVTDAVAWRAGGVGAIEVEFDGHAARLADGTLAGSALTMDRAVRNLVRVVGADLLTAVEAASTTPADLLGLADRGRLAPGTRADVVALGPDLAVEGVWIAGERVR